MFPCKKMILQAEMRKYAVPTELLGAMGSAYSTRADTAKQLMEELTGELLRKLTQELSRDSGTFDPKGASTDES